MRGWRPGMRGWRSRALVAVALVAGLLVSCDPAGNLGSPSGRAEVGSPDDDPYVVEARPMRRAGNGAPTGKVPLVPGSPGDGWLVVPDTYRAERPAALIVCLRGAGGQARAALRFFRDAVEDHGLILVAPEARGRTWDAALGSPGGDAAFIGDALDRVFRRYAVDPRRVAVAGFSDGGSFSLTLGLTNGRLFRHVIAFSPGFIDVRNATGNPRVFVSHGTSDDSLPIERTSEPIVAGLREAGYDVTFRRFDGEHGVPEPIRAAALRWLEGSVG